MKMKKRILIHIPKNAGMSFRHRQSPLRRRGQIIPAKKAFHKSEAYTEAVGATMKKYGQHHGFEHARLRDLNPKFVKKYGAVAVVRNPWDRVVSRFTFSKTVGERPEDYPFEDFLEERHEWGGKKYFWHRGVLGWFDQKDYVTYEDGTLGCDVLRFEHLSDDVLRYFRPAHVPGFFNVSNGDQSSDRRAVSGRVPYQKFYNAETMQIVYDWHKEDIDFFGFSYDGPATKNVLYV